MTRNMGIKSLFPFLFATDALEVWANLFFGGVVSTAEQWGGPAVSKVSIKEPCWAKDLSPPKIQLIRQWWKLE